MANPRQRKKSRSSSTHTTTLTQRRRMRTKLRKAPPLRGPDALAEAWDSKKTVFQNYAELGLLASLPVPTSNSRIKMPFLPPAPASTSAVPSTSTSAASAGTGTKGKGKETESKSAKAAFGRIVRDEKGNVVDIIIEEDEDEDQGEEEEEEGNVKMDEDEEEVVKRVEAKTDVVRQLEKISASGAPVKRHTSTSERTWLADLVRAYGDDTASMAKDRTKNVWQKTEGEIKRMIKKAGGVDKLSRA